MSTALQGARLECVDSEMLRCANFTTAVRAYEWELAKDLAKTEEETSDLAGSVARVEWLRHHVSKGEFSRAFELVITQEEREQVELAQAAAA